jgi:hypothetical protein
MNTINTTPVNFGTHTRYFPLCRGEIDFFVDALDIKTGKAIKVVSDIKVAEAFGIINMKPINYNSLEANAVMVGTMGKVIGVPIGSYKSRIKKILGELIEPNREHFVKNFCRGALEDNSEPIRCVNLPAVYKALFKVQLNQQQRMDLGIVIRNAIPEVKNRPKVLTIHSETKEPIWILHYTVYDIPKIAEEMLSMHGY